MWSIAEAFPFYFNAIQTLLRPWCDSHRLGWELCVSFDEDEGDASGGFTVDQFDRTVDDLTGALLEVSGSDDASESVEDTGDDSQGGDDEKDDGLDGSNSNVLGEDFERYDPYA
jgi:hypothetical protein